MKFDVLTKCERNDEQSSNDKLCGENVLYVSTANVNIYTRHLLNYRAVIVSVLSEQMNHKN